MYSHLTLGSNDLARSKTFYDALFTAVGGAAGTLIPDRERVLYLHNGGMLMIVKPIDGEPATHGNGGTIGLAMASPEQVEAWHAAGVANGGTTCEDPPGVRAAPGLPRMHLAYLRDPDNNKLCGIYRYTD